MPQTLANILAHTRARNRPTTNDAILVAEIERLEGEVVRLEAQIRINAEAHFRPLANVNPKETTDV